MSQGLLERKKGFDFWNGSGPPLRVELGPNMKEQVSKRQNDTGAGYLITISHTSIWRTGDEMDMP